MTTFTHLECAFCGQRYQPSRSPGACACGGPLFARYDLDLARASWSRDWIRNGPVNLWRYAPVLPVRRPSALVSLGEGMTPLVHLSRLGARLGASRLWLKQEGANPTGSCKARRMACVVSMARELGFERLVISSAGNAAVALAAYAAVARLRASVLLPRRAPELSRTECAIFGADVIYGHGDTRVVPRQWEREIASGACRDAGAWREPYALEGAKTLGYELAEQFNWEPPGAVLCPCGSGLGSVALWKAFQELAALGWVAG
ncbi:MAG: pyridoxal-phosphate dependent enzyme, partial [Bryobacteraceae bacterium]